MPSGFELKPTRLMPLMERSECREVLLVEWGAPARETRPQHGPAAALESGGGRKSCPAPDARVPSATREDRLYLALLSHGVPAHHPEGADPAHTPVPRGTPGGGPSAEPCPCPGTLARRVSWSSRSAQNLHHGLRHLDKHNLPLAILTSLLVWS